MPTIRIVSLKPGGGGDYNFLPSWSVARARDLVALDEIEIVECYGGGNCGSVNVNGWNTSASCYVKIRAAEGHEHQGKWDSSKAYIRATVNGIVINDTGTAHCHVVGLQIEHASANLSVYALRSTVGNFAGIFERILIRKTVERVNQYGISLTGNGQVRNSIVIGYAQSGCIGFFANGSVTRFLNCTAAGCWRGYQFAFGGPYSRNCLATGCTDGFYSTVGNHDYNASDLPNDAPGPNSRNGQVFSFVDPAGGDFHLRLTDQGALRRGLDLSSLFGFNDDVEGKTRIGLWDVGADQHDPETYSGTARLSGAAGVEAADGAKIGAGSSMLASVAAVDAISGRLGSSTAWLAAAAAVDADGGRENGTVLPGVFHARTDMPVTFRARTELRGDFHAVTGVSAEFDPESGHSARFRAATSLTGDFNLISEITQ